MLPLLLGLLGTRLRLSPVLGSAPMDTAVVRSLSELSEEVTVYVGNDYRISRKALIILATLLFWLLRRTFSWAFPRYCPAVLRNWGIWLAGLSSARKSG